MTAWWDFEDFSGRIGERFLLVLPDGGEMNLTLTAVTEGSQPGGAGPGGRARRQFSLVFTGPAQPGLDQGTRELRHEGLGTVALFLVPIGDGPGGRRYEAAFA